MATAENGIFLLLMTHFQGWFSQSRQLGKKVKFFDKNFNFSMFFDLKPRRRGLS